ncbi:MAG: RNA-binding protein [Candidatus Aenigmatarchaeota archaeon]|nr:MAG: RNA-binding protein [Candidatus Aenigmarchaeota archaeon]
MNEENKTEEKKPETAEKPQDNAQAKGLLKKEREFVIPGDKIVDTMDYLPGRNCFRKGDSVFATKIGLVGVNGRVVSVIPLNESYIPKAGDMVIGEVVDIQNNGWVVDIKSADTAYLPLSGIREFIDVSKTDLSNYYDIGDAIYAKISLATDNSTQLTMDDSRARKFKDGRILTINPAKVPRIIGKKGSMISIIKSQTGCRISVGQNGLIWIEGGDEELAIKAIGMVEKNSYLEGLTEKVSELLGYKPGEQPAEQAERSKEENVDG